MSICLYMYFLVKSVPLFPNLNLRHNRLTYTLGIMDSHQILYQQMGCYKWHDHKSSMGFKATKG